MSFCKSPIPLYLVYSISLGPTLPVNLTIINLIIAVQTDVKNTEVRSVLRMLLDVAPLSHLPPVIAI
jgi:hypothetical protein